MVHDILKWQLRPDDVIQLFFMERSEQPRFIVDSARTSGSNDRKLRLLIHGLCSNRRISLKICLSDILRRITMKVWTSLFGYSMDLNKALKWKLCHRWSRQVEPGAEKQTKEGRIRCRTEQKRALAIMDDSNTLYEPRIDDSVYAYESFIPNFLVFKTSKRFSHNSRFKSRLVS